DGASAEAHHFFKSRRRLMVQILFRGLLQFFGAVHDSTAFFGDFLIAQTVDSVHKFLLPIAGVNNMAVAVAPGWHHYFSAAIQRFKTLVRPHFVHSSVIFYHAVVYKNPSV